MDNGLEILIKIRDEATEKLKSMSSQIQDAKEKAGDMSKQFMAVGAGMTAVGVAGGLALKDFIDKAAQSQQGLNQLSSVLRSTHGAAGMTKDSVLQLSDSLSRMSGIDDDAVTAAQNMLLTFTGIHKQVFPQTTQAVLDMATAMNNGATPSAEQLSQTAIQVGKALNDPIMGITALHRVGVAFTEAQKEQIKTLEQSGNLQGAQAIILKELQTEFGGSAKAAGDTFTGAMNKLHVAVENVEKAIGAQFLPVLKTVALVFVDFARKIQDMNPVVFRVIAVVLGLVTAIGLVGGPMLFILGLLPTLAAGFGVFMAIVSPLAIGLVAVAAAAFLIYTQWNNIQMLFNRFILPTIKAVWAEMNKFYLEVAPKIMPAVQNIVALFQWLFGQLEAGWNANKDQVMAVMSVIVGVIQVAWDLIKGIIFIALDLIGGKWGQAWTDAKQMFVNIWNDIKNTAIAVTSDIVDAVKHMVNGVIDAINGMIHGANKVASAIHLPSLPDIPHFEKGGYVPYTGLAVVHQGEYVLTKDQVQGNKQMPSIVNQNSNASVVVNVQATQEADWNLLGYKVALALRNNRR